MLTITDNTSTLARHTATTPRVTLNFIPLNVNSKNLAKCTLLATVVTSVFIVTVEAVADYSNFDAHFEHCQRLCRPYISSYGHCLHACIDAFKVLYGPTEGNCIN